MLLFSVGNGTKIQPLEMGRKSPGVFRVTGLKILGMVGTHILWKKYKSISPFKMHNIIFLSRKHGKNSRFHQ